MTPQKPDPEAIWRRNITVLQLMLAMAPTLISMGSMMMSYAAFKTSVELKISAIEDKNKGYDLQRDRVSDLITSERVVEERSREQGEALKDLKGGIDRIAQLLEQRK